MSKDHPLCLVDAQESTLIKRIHDRMKDQNKGLAAGVRSKPSSGSNNDFACFYIEQKSVPSRDEVISASNLDLDVLPDIPTVTALCSKGHIDASDQDSVQTELINGLADSSKLNAMGDCRMEFVHSDIPHNEDSFMVHRSCSFLTSSTVQRDNKPEISVNEHDDKGSDCFLGCDWDSIEDFDLDTIFRTSDSMDHIFGNDMMDISDGFLSPSDHLIGSITEFVPVPDTAPCKEELSDNDFSSLQLAERCDAKGNELQRKQIGFKLLWC